MFRKCKTVSQQYQECNGSTCQTKTRKVKEGVDYKALPSQTMSKWADGNTICYKRGNIDYEDISKDRKFFTENSNKVGCKTSFGYAKCGGSNTGSLNTEFSYCYKMETANTTETCPVQHLSYNKKAPVLTREKASHEPIYGFSIASYPACIDGRKYTPKNALLEEVF